MIRMSAMALVLGVLALTGCASSGGVAAGDSFSLARDEAATLPDGSRLQYLGIANDSRCPPTVTCIRAGDADVLFQHDTGSDTGSATRVVLNTERNTSTDLGRWHLQLLDLAAGAQPRVTLRLQER